MPAAFPNRCQHLSDHADQTSICHEPLDVRTVTHFAPVIQPLLPRTNITMGLEG